MKVMHTVLEGTPEELRQLPEFAAILAGIGAAGTTVNGAAGDGYHDLGLPAELDNYIAGRGVNNPNRELVRQMAASAIERGAVWTIGKSKSSPDGKTPYFSLYAPGPQRHGAVAYAHPVNGRVTVRLTWEDDRIDAALRPHVFRASEQPDKMYSVGVMVTNSAALEAVKRLIDLAIDSVTS